MKGKNRKPNEYSCGNRGVFDRAWQKGEQVFVLRSQDRTAPSTIAWWILQNIETATEEKLRHALDDALRARRWPNRKSAD